MSPTLLSLKPRRRPCAWAVAGVGQVYDPCRRQVTRATAARIAPGSPLAFAGAVLWGLGVSLGFLGDHYTVLRALIAVSVLLGFAALISYAIAPPSSGAVRPKRSDSSGGSASEAA